MRYKLCLIEKTLLYHKADNSVLKFQRHKDITINSPPYAVFSQNTEGASFQNKKQPNASTFGCLY